MRHKSRSKRSPWLLTKWAVLVLAGVGVVVGLAARQAPRVVEQRLNQDDVRQKIAQSVARRLDLKVGIQPLQWSGLHVSTDGVEMVGQPPQSLTELRAHHVEANGSLAEIMDGKWRLDSLTAQHVEMAFGKAAHSKLSDAFQQPPQLESASDRPPLFKTDIAKLSVSRTDVFWGKTEKALGWVRGTATETTHEGDRFKIEGKGGEFQQHGWPKVAMESCRIIYGQKFLEIEEASMTLGEKGQVLATGKFDFDEQSDMKLAFEFHHCSISPFLSDETRKKFSGVFSGDTHIADHLDEKSSAQIEGKVDFSDARIRNVSGLARVADFTGRDEFRHPKLSVLRGRYVSNGPTIEIKDLVAGMEGLARLEGDLAVKNESLRGTFELGLAPSVVEKFPGAREQVFTKQRDGLLWAKVAVRGTLKAPETDLKDRLVKAAEAYFEKKILAAVLKPGKATVEALKQLW